jgi:AcrR family transcriptional regulator
MDRRMRKTKVAIYAAFSELLAKKKYSQITIEQIINLADIGRSTFYSHFDTKDELLKSMCLDMFQSMALSEHSLDITDSHSIVTELLCHIKNNKKAINGVITSESGNLFIRYFKDYFNQRIEKLLDRFDKPYATVPKDFLINHISGSFIEMVEWWVESGMKQTPEELTEYYLSVISPIIM